MMPSLGISEDRKTRNPEAHRRQQQLLRWVSQDRASGDMQFRTALRNWLQDVVCRISEHRPQTIRMPNVLVCALQLAGQQVVILENDEVRVAASQFGRTSKHAGGLVILPARES